MSRHTDFLRLLPNELACQSIEAGKKVLLTHQRIADTMWVVLLTDMPEQQDKAWKMPAHDYWAITSLHESRDRWIRNRITPTFTGIQNPPKQGTQTSLF